MCTWELDRVVVVVGEGRSAGHLPHHCLSLIPVAMHTRLQQPLDDEISKEVFISKSRSSCYSLRPCGFQKRLVEKDFTERK